VQLRHTPPLLQRKRIQCIEPTRWHKGSSDNETHLQTFAHVFFRNFKDVDFVELHATGLFSAFTILHQHFINVNLSLGTAQGDPTEANWVGRIFQREDQLLVGSVKGNIG